jgi:probable rRNA maturation factor
MPAAKRASPAAKRVNNVPKSLVTVEVSYGLPSAGLPDAALFRTWTAAAVAGRRDAAEVSIHITDTVEGQALNLRYRHKDYATNVLSFQAEFPPGVNHPLIGDIVICAPVVAKEAADQGKTLGEHYAHLTVHGVLHLLGLDHETVAEARAMEAVEVQVLEKLGIQDPYRQR